MSGPGPKRTFDACMIYVCSWERSGHRDGATQMSATESKAEVRIGKTACGRWRSCLGSGSERLPLGSCQEFGNYLALDTEVDRATSQLLATHEARTVSVQARWN
jgi:hypothetical protein